MGQTLHAHLNGYDKEIDVLQSASVHGHFSATLFNIAETTSGAPPPLFFFFCTGVYKVILQSREVSFIVGRLLFKPLPQGPLRLCMCYHQFPLHTYLLFMTHLLCQNCFVCMWPYVVQRLYGWSTFATPHWRWYSRYLMRWLALGVATASRRVAQSVTQCSVPSSGLEGRAVMLYDRHKVKLCF